MHGNNKYVLPLDPICYNALERIEYHNTTYEHRHVIRLRHLLENLSCEKNKKLISCDRYHFQWTFQQLKAIPSSLIQYLFNFEKWKFQKLFTRISFTSTFHLFHVTSTFRHVLTATSARKYRSRPKIRFCWCTICIQGEAEDELRLDEEMERVVWAEGGPPPLVQAGGEPLRDAAAPVPLHPPPPYMRNPQGSSNNQHIENTHGHN